MGTMVRCEYCGQLYEGLSCPHCCAPRSDDSDVDILYADGVPYWRSDVGFIDPEASPDTVDYFLVDIDPYKDKRAHDDMTGESHPYGAPDEFEQFMSNVDAAVNKALVVLFIAIAIVCAAFFLIARMIPPIGG